MSVSLQDLHDAIAERKRQLLAATLIQSRTMTPASYRFVVAPMVGASDLAFRLMTRKYGATLCYTPMFYSDRFVQDEVYRERVFKTVPEDRPLVVQFAANTPEMFVAAAKLVQGHCDAVDLNLGCPTREARSLRYGSYLLDPKDRSLVMAMVKEASASLDIPVFCKMRLLDSLNDTLLFAQGLEENGCKMLTVHGRKRGSTTNRRKGAADLQAIRAVKSALSIPVVSNGNVQSWQDVMHNLSVTGCDGIMSAEEVLRNPALFYPSVQSTENKDPVAEAKEPEETPEDGRPDPLGLALEYVDAAQTHGTPVTWVIRHVKYIAERLLMQYQVHDDILGATTAEQIMALLRTCRERRDSGTYIFDRLLQTQQKVQFATRAKERALREQADRMLHGPLQQIDGTFEQQRLERAARQRAAALEKKRKLVEDPDDPDDQNDQNQAKLEDETFYEPTA